MINTQEQNDRDLRTVLKTAAGRRTLWRVLCMARAGENGFVPRDPYATAYFCGQQSIAVWLQEELWRADPAAYMGLRRESEQNIPAPKEEEDV